MSKAICIQTPSMSSGHGPFPPTPSSGPYSTTAFVNSSNCQLTNQTLYIPHGNVPTFSKWHPSDDGTQRIVSSGSSTLFIENKPAAKITSSIDCGDITAIGAFGAYIE